MTKYTGEREGLGLERACEGGRTLKSTQVLTSLPQTPWEGSRFLLTLN